MTPSMAFKLSRREKQDTLRTIKSFSNKLIDFSSNDTLGLSKRLFLSGQTGSTDPGCSQGTQNFTKNLKTGSLISMKINWHCSLIADIWQIWDC